MKIDTSQTVQLQAPASSGRDVAMLTGIALIFIAVAAGNYSFGGTAPALASLALVIICAIGALLGVLHILRGDQVKLTLSPSGLIDSRHAGGEISWRDVRDVGLRRFGDTDLVTLKLSDQYLRRNGHPTALGRLMRVGKYDFAGNGLLVSHRPFGWSAQKLRDLIEAYVNDHSMRAPRT